jgi:DNA-binding LacI/PurR family transcriptional regulator
MQVVAFNVTSHEQRDRQLRRLRMVDQTAGLIIISLFPTDEDIAALQRAGVAVVLLDAEHPAATRVVVDDVHGGELAAEHLLSLGHSASPSSVTTGRTDSSSGRPDAAMRDKARSGGRGSRSAGSTTAEVPTPERRHSG